MNAGLGRGALVVGVAGIVAALAPHGAGAASTSIVISQVYTAAGASGYFRDYIELHNTSASTVDMDGWSVQYSDTTDAAGASYQETDLNNVSIGPGAYFLIGEGGESTAGTDLPPLDASGVIHLAVSDGKVALRTAQSSCSVGSCVADGATLDFVGYGSAQEHEGTAAAPSPDDTHAVFRAHAGEQDTDQNGDDFSLASPAPRNSATTPLDEMGPTATTFALAAFQSNTTFPVGWSATDPDGVVEYESRARSAPPNAGFGSYSSWYTGANTTANRHAALGETVCVSTRAEDGNLNWGSFTAERCTAVPLDDRALTAISFSRQMGTNDYKGTFSLATVTGAKLKSPVVTAKRFALLATKCPTCGSVKVTWQGTTLATVSLHASTTVRKVLIPLPPLASAQAGVLQITSLSATRVEIDGLGVSRK